MSENENPNPPDGGEEEIPAEGYSDNHINWYIQLTMDTPPESPEAAQELVSKIVDRVREIHNEQNGEPGDAETAPQFHTNNSGLPVVIPDNNVPIMHMKLYITNPLDENAILIDRTRAYLVDNPTALGLSVSIVAIDPGAGILGRSNDPNNWGGGGPGGYPIAPAGAIANTGMKDINAPYYFHLPAFLDGLRTSDGGRNAVIAILDTCPSAQVWANAKAQYRVTHPIIQSLEALEAAGKFVMMRDPASGAITPSEEGLITATSAGFFSYPIVDHGLFVAGIIHSIAPLASIVLYRAMDDEGRCLINSVEDALVHVTMTLSRTPALYPQFINKPIVVNCSLTFIMPNEEAARDVKFSTENYWAAIMQQSTVLAAAGNEASYRTRPGGSKPPYPRFPAGYESTLGVTALDKMGNRSSFANWADDYDRQPDVAVEGGALVPRQGIAAYGGNITMPGTDRITDPTDSILGIFISATYPAPGNPAAPVANTSGWAKWSGTSFSTGIASGAMALLASNAKASGTPTNRNALTQELINRCGLRLRDAIGGVQTYTEYILPVTQG